ncbi:hypothetical protein BDF14DRAFT_1999264 [Spinellus fusiger]|nr:hypothetical protein BDF14DRAFT_1999264 [Spinellus fusiger]
MGHLLSKTDDYDLDSEDATIEDLATNQPMLHRTAPTLSVEMNAQATSTITWCDSKTAILSAMHALHKLKEIQRQKLLVAELGELQPIGIIRNGLEHNFLADSNTIPSVLETEDPLLMICCTEVYGQTPEHDDHHEKIKSTKTQILPSSLPQPFTRYPNIEVK